MKLAEKYTFNYSEIVRVGNIFQSYYPVSKSVTIIDNLLQNEIKGIISYEKLKSHENNKTKNSFPKKTRKISKKMLANFK